MGDFLIGYTSSREAEDIPDEGDRVESQRQCWVEEVEEGEAAGQS